MALPALRKRGIAVLLGTVCSLVMAEATLRVWDGDLLAWKDHRRPFGSRPLGSKAPNRFDAALGWVPKAGRRPWKKTVETVDERGLRSNGAPPPPGAPLLAVGDSFTFGDEVDDDQTWPAHLERRLGRPVLNGGVSGYGIDQAVLRAEELLALHAPARLLLAACPDDVLRCERFYYGQWKPYFAVEDGRLVARSVPAPAGRMADDGLGPRPAPDTGWLSRSVLADFVCKRIASRWWYFGFGKAHGEGEVVAALLVLRLDALARAAGVPLMFIALDQRGSRDRARLVPVIERARAAGVDVLDLGPGLAARWREPEWRDAMYRRGGHPGPETNAWIADRIAAHLSARDR